MTEQQETPATVYDAAPGSQVLAAKLTTEKLTTVGKNASTKSEALWLDVSPVATWKACPQHGYVSRPHLVKLRSAQGGKYVKAICPDCVATLGFIPQKPKRRGPGSFANLKVAFRIYRETAAEAKGRA